MIDMNLSPRWCAVLQAAGCEAVRRPAIGAPNATDVRTEASVGLSAWSVVLRGCGITAAHMTRPQRIEFPGAVYHVTARGDRREPIFEDDRDRENLLAVVGEGMERFDAVALAYCLMGNHYHFVCRRAVVNCRA